MAKAANALTLNILMVEDVEEDALLILQELHLAGLTPRWQRIQTAAEFEAAVDSQAWDVIISDYRLPQFSAPAALAILQQHQQDAPFILVSGVLSDSTAVEMMQAGAHDYVMKDNLTRLPAAIRREVQDAQMRADRKQIALELQIAQRTADLRTQQCLRERMAEITPHFLYLYDLQTQRILYTNQKIGSLLGYDSEAIEVMANNFFTHLVHPEDYSVIARHHCCLAAVPDEQSLNVEYRLRDRQGNWHWFVSCDVVFARDSTHQPTQILGSAIDITDRKQAEDCLRKSEARYRALMNGASDVILLANAQGRLVEVNCKAEELLCYTREELTAMHFTQLHPAADLEAVTVHFQAALAGHSPTAIEVDVRCKNGQIIPVSIASTLVQLEGITLIQGIMRDICDRKAYEAQLQQTNAELAHATRLKDEFLANMSHELRTPLNAILGMTEALQENVFGSLNTRQQQSLTTIEHSGRHLLALINDILDLAKVESGKMELDITQVAIQSLCKTSLSFVRELAHKKHIDLVLQISDSMAGLSVAVDERRMHQVLINLLSNAIKFTHQDGDVTLAVDLETCSPPASGLEVDDAAVQRPTANENTLEMVTISVIDTGIGIAPENLTKLFQSFVQIDSKLNRQYEGTGLGLALVKRITEMHGGTVTVDSEVNRGSCFTIKLPSHLLQSKTAHRDRTTHRPSRPWQGGKQVFVIEDSEAAAEQIVRYLKEEKLVPTLQRSGENALARVMQLQPALVILDVQLPGQTGWEILTQLKANPQTQSIPVIITSVVDERQKGRMLGAVDYLVKPFSREQLRESFRNLMGSPAPEPIASAPAQPMVEKIAPLVLLVENNEANCYSISGYLEAKGYRLAIATDGYEAIHLVQVEEPDIILISLDVPDINGLDVTQQIRALPECACLPIIALTASAVPGDSEQCLVIGANACLAKPVKLKELVTTIGTLIQGE